MSPPRQPTAWALGGMMGGPLAIGPEPQAEGRSGRLRREAQRAGPVRAGVEARIAAGEATIRRPGGLVARGELEEADAGPDPAHFAHVRAAARDELADLRLPSAIPALDQVDIEVFRRCVLAA